MVQSVEVQLIQDLGCKWCSQPSARRGEEKVKARKQTGSIRDFSPNLTFTGREIPLQSQRLVLPAAFLGPHISFIHPQAVLSTSIS